MKTTHPRNPKRGVEPCAAPWCDLLVVAVDWCHTHYEQMRVNGKLTPPREPNYLIAHRQIRKLRGPASKQRCAECPHQAKDWSLDRGRDVEFLVDKTDSVNRGKQFSMDVMDYIPRCKPCHNRADAIRGELHKWSKLTEAQVIEIFISADSESVTAARYGIAQSNVSQIRTRKTWSKVTAPYRRASDSM